MNFSDLTNNELLSLLDDKRAKYMRHNLAQSAFKISLNSLYGVLGNRHFVFYELKMAEAITLTGQYLIKLVANKMNDWLNQICCTVNFDFRLFGDTDSCYFNFLPVVDKFFPNASDKEKLDKIAAFSDGPASKKIAEIIAEASKNLNAFNPNAIKMEREVICDAVIVVAKKRNVMSIIDKEGIRKNPPQVKITGLDSKRSMLSKPIRKKLEEAYKVAMYNPEGMIEFVSKFRKDFEDFDIDDMAAVSGVNNIEKFEHKHKGVPKHVRAAINHNKYIDLKDLKELVNPIISGDKMKMVMLKMPNPVHDDIFGFEGDWKSIYNIDKYVDRKAQFEKSFIAPLENLTKIVGIDIMPKQTYDLF